MRLKEPKVLEYVSAKFPFVTEIRFEDVPERCGTCRATFPCDPEENLWMELEFDKREPSGRVAKDICVEIEAYATLKGEEE